MKSAQIRFGLAIRRLRLAQGYTQEKFALDANINRSYMGQIERGEINITLSNLERLAKGRKMTMGELMAEVDREN